MAGRAYEVLFLCTGNSARSILAEALLNHWGTEKFNASSAGSHPTGRVHPMVLELLARMGIPAPGARSKSWDEFAGAGGRKFDFVITVCDRAAAETCPVWPGQPVTAHWGMEDPAARQGSEAIRMLAFRETFRALEQRIRIFVSLPIASLDRPRLERELARIGRERPLPEAAGR